MEEPEQATISHKEAPHFLNPFVGCPNKQVLQVFFQFMPCSMAARIRVQLCSLQQFCQLLHIMMPL